MKRLTVTVFLLVMACGPLLAQDSAGLSKLIASAQHKATVDGDLRGAIRDLETVVSRAGGNKTIAAQALLQLAGYHQALGDAQAMQTYERIVRDFANTPEAVTARTRLQQPPPAGRSTLTVRLLRDDRSSSISADGRWLSFTDWSTGNLMVRDLSSGRDRAVTAGADTRKEYAEESVVSPDGKTVAYSWFKPVGRKTIFEPDGSRYELRVTDVTAGGVSTPRVIFGDEGIAWVQPYDWSNDGKTVLAEFERRDHTSELALISTADRSVKLLRTPGTGFGRASLSRDGRIVAYDRAVNPSSNDRDIALLSTDSGNETDALTMSGHDVVVGWLPDGRLLFMNTYGVASNLFAVRMAGGRFQGPAALIRADVNRFSPLGVTRSGTLYYNLITGGPFEIRMASVDFTRGEVLSPATIVAPEFYGTNGDPAFSPDGKSIAYVSRRDTGRSNDVILVIRSLETGAVRELHSEISILNWPRWSPDSRYIAVAGSNARGTNRGIYVIDVQTGTTTLALSVPGERPQFGFNWPTDRNVLYATKSSDDTAEHGVFDVTSKVFSPRFSMPRTQIAGPGVRASADLRNLYYQRTPAAGSNPMGSTPPGAKLASIVERNYGTGDERVIVTTSVFDVLWPPSPDASVLTAHRTDAASGVVALSVISVSNGRVREVLQAPSGTTLAFAAWSRDSRSLLMWRTQGDRKTRELWWISVDGTTKRLDLPTASNNNINSDSFTLHPDGKRIAWQNAPENGEKVETWVMDGLASGR
jgi:Tol biopolymer transport system component